MTFSLDTESTSLISVSTFDTLVNVKPYEKNLRGIFIIAPSAKVANVKSNYIVPLSREDTSLIMFPLTKCSIKRFSEEIPCKHQCVQVHKYSCS